MTIHHQVSLSQQEKVVHEKVVSDNQPDARVGLGTVVLRALQRSEMTVKEMARLTGYEPKTLYAALQGKPGYPLDLHKLGRMPWKWKAQFLPLLAFEWARELMQDLRGGFDDAQASR